MLLNPLSRSRERINRKKLKKLECRGQDYWGKMLYNTFLVWWNKGTAYPSHWTNSVQDKLKENHTLAHTIIQLTKAEQYNNTESSLKDNLSPSTPYKRIWVQVIVKISTFRMLWDGVFIGLKKKINPEFK